MFAWIGSQFENILSTYVFDVISALIEGIAPIALAGMTIWVALYGWAVTRNQATESVPEFAWKLFKMAFVVTFALQAGVYIDNVAEVADALALGVATTFLPSSADPMAITSPYALIDAFNDRANQLVLDLLKEASIMRMDLLFATVVTSFGNVLFLCVAMFIVTLAKVFMAFVIAIGPIFILCLAWRPTARFFDSWLSMVLSTVVMTWFSFFALGVSVHLGDTILQTIQDQGGFLGPNLNVVAESLQYCVVMILMAVLCFQAPTLAAALTGGAVVQQGVQMIQSAMMVAGLRSAASGRGASGGAGGTIRSGAGAAYTAGHAAGTVVRGGRNVARMAAYQLAALRGRERR